MCKNNLNLHYKVDRGAHTYWLEKGTLEVRPDHILNLIHYEVIPVNHVHCMISSNDF